MTFSVYYGVTTWLCTNNGQCDSCCSSFLWTVDVGQYFLSFFLLLLLFLEIWFLKKKTRKCWIKWCSWFKPFCKNESKMCMTKKLRILIFELWSCLSFCNSPKTKSSYHSKQSDNMDEATSSKMLDHGLGTQIQNCLNVNAIKQVLCLHEHNVTNDSQDVGKICLLLGKKKLWKNSKKRKVQAKPINVSCLGDWILFVLDLWFFCVCVWCSVCMLRWCKYAL